MSLQSCRECGEQISSQAKVCPKCGVKNPVKSKNWLDQIKNNPKKSVAIFLLIAMFGAVNDHDGRSSNTSATSQNVAAHKSDAELLYDILYQEGTRLKSSNPMITDVKFDTASNASYSGVVDVLQLYISSTQPSDAQAIASEACYELHSLQVLGLWEVAVFLVVGDRPAAKCGTE